MVHVFPSNVAMLKAAPEALDGAGAFLETAFSKGSIAGAAPAIGTHSLLEEAGLRYGL
jgi:hypothetical protein